MRIRVGLAVPLLLLASFNGSMAIDEKALLAEVTPDELSKHASEIVKHVRPGGSPGELAAVDYIVATLRADGIPVEVHEFEAYVSDPLGCGLRVESSPVREMRCLTQALAAPTPPDGVRGEVVYVGEGTADDYEKADVNGKVVLVNALPYPWGVKDAGDAGAIGAIFMSDSERLQELTVSPIWGTPNHENYHELPVIPSITVNQPDGEALREAAGSGALRVFMQSEVATGWKTLRLPVATIESARDPEGYVLVGGHIDGWHHGAVDEGASNAAMVEFARIFHRHRDELERGLKVAWWPAHSNGRYAGLAWFVDAFWLDLRDNALAYMNIDGVGQMGATRYGSANIAEMDGLSNAVFRDVAGESPEPNRPGRNSDQGFYGIGLPLLQFNHGRTDEGGRYWWWHTTEDTFDKIDFEVLASDAKLYVSALSRLLTEPVPPIRMAAATEELKARLEERQKLAASHFDLSQAIERAGELHALARELDESLPGADASSAPEVSRRMVRVLRPVLRVTYEEHGPHHQDPALPIPTLPGLSALESLGELSPDSDLYGFTLVYLVRERNRLATAGFAHEFLI